MVRSLSPSSNVDTGEYIGSRGEHGGICVPFMQGAWCVVCSAVQCSAMRYACLQCSSQSVRGVHSVAGVHVCVFIVLVLFVINDMWGACTA